MEKYIVTYAIMEDEYQLSMYRLGKIFNNLELARNEIYSYIRELINADDEENILVSILMKIHKDTIYEVRANIDSSIYVFLISEV